MSTLAMEACFKLFIVRSATFSAITTTHCAPVYLVVIAVVVFVDDAASALASAAAYDVINH